MGRDERVPHFPCKSLEDFLEKSHQMKISRLKAYEKYPYTVLSAQTQVKSPSTEGFFVVCHSLWVT